jgi:hypothetical protein
VTALHQRLLVPLLVIFGAIGLFAYGIIAATSQDPLWFQGRAVLPEPARIVIRVDGRQTVLTPASPGYERVRDAARKALSSFRTAAPGSAGLSEATLAQFESQGVFVAMYFDAPVNFRLPFNDGQPRALFIPVRGRFGGDGYVFRGDGERWWAGQLVMRDPGPLVDALAELDYLE